MKTSISFLRVLSALILFGSFLARPAFAENIKVGILLSLTGKLAEYGEMEKKAFLMAENEINAAGLLDGRAIELIIKDTKGRPDVGASAMEELILTEKVDIVTGGISSSVAWAAAAVAEQRDVPFLINTASADKITEQGWRYVFRLNPPVSEYPQALASFLKKVTQVQTAAVLYENTYSGLVELKRFLRQCKDLGVDVTMKESYEAGTSDLSSLLFRLSDIAPDLVYMVSQASDAPVLIQKAKALQVRPKLFLGNSPTYAETQFKTNAGDASEYVYAQTIWSPAVPYPGVKKYCDAFVKKYRIEPDYHAAQAYAAMYVIEDALKRTQTPTPKGIRDALVTTDMMTVFGPVKFTAYDKKTQQNKLPTYLVQWINGKLETVWPREVATAKYIYPFPTD